MCSVLKTANPPNSALTTTSDIFIPFSRPVFTNEEEEAVIHVLRSGWLTTGPETSLFEAEFAAFTGVGHALAVNSATSGLHLSLECVGTTSGDLVITSPYTFTATAEVIRYLGAHPLFVDIERDSYNINPYLVETAVKQARRQGKKIRAMIPVHIGGLEANMAALEIISRQYDIPIIEDAAHAFPLRCTDGIFAGTKGLLGVYSFYANKTITTGEGGMVVTRDSKLAARIALMRNHGIDRHAWDRYTSSQAGWHYQVIEPGYKYNLTDIASAIGRVQLRKADAFWEQRKAVADFYCRYLEGCEFIKLPQYREHHAWHLFIIRLDSKALDLSRDQVINLLKKRGIGTSVHYIPLHIMPYYQKQYKLKPHDFPVALENYKQCLSLPIYPGLSQDQLTFICDTLLSLGKTRR